MLGIRAAYAENDLMKLKPIPRHFKRLHNCDASLLQIRGIDVVLQGKRGGDFKTILAQREVVWIVTLDTMTPMGLNEALSFVPFL